MLAIVGAVFLVYSAHMPLYSNEPAYNEAYLEINDRLADGEIGYDEASRLFYMNQNNYMTNKYWLESVGLSCIIAAAYGGAVLAFMRSMRRLGKTVHKAWLYAVTCGSLLLSGSLLIFAVYVEYERGLLPYWADSLGIPVFGTATLLCVSLPASAGVTYMLSRSYQRQKPRTTVADLKDLSPGAKAYFTITAIITVLAVVWLAIYPAYVFVPIVFGGALFNFLLITGAARNYKL